MQSFLIFLVLNFAVCVPILKQKKKIQILKPGMKNSAIRISQMFRNHFAIVAKTRKFANSENWPKISLASEISLS